MIFQKVTKNKKKTLKRLMALCMASTMFLSVPVLADTKKPTLSATKMNISLGAKGTHKINNTFSQGVHQITIQNPVKGAKYVCTSSNKKVLSVKTKNNKINLTGVSAGSATITCKQTLKGKTTVVGKAKIIVHNAKAVFVDPSNWNLGIYRREFSAISNGNSGLGIQYYSTDDKVNYTFQVDKKGLTVKDEKAYNSDANNMINLYPTKGGVFKVTVTQTYEKKKKTIGSISLNFKEPNIHKTQELYVDSAVSIADIMDYYSFEREYYLEANGQNLYQKDENNSLYVDSANGIWGMKEGSFDVKIYDYHAQTKEKGKLLGTCTFIVKGINN